MNKKQIKLIAVDPSNIDDVFIYKHKVEEEIAKEKNEEVKRMKIDEFINDYLHLSDKSYFCSKTQTAVAFNIKIIKRETVCFHTLVDKDTMNAFKSTMENLNWDINKVPSHSPKDIYEDIEGNDFFVIGNDISLVSK